MLLNQTFMVMAITKGLDGAIVNPLDKKMMAAIITAGTLMGKDEWCEAYLEAYRQKRFEF
jgi:5-methyltetrahydrofolate--homocysteine methyltransferase